MEIAIEFKYNGKKIYGYKKCPGWLKLKYRKAVNYICQDCKKPESEVGTLEPHRVIRSVEGGLYLVLPLNHPLSNCKILCHKCHQKYNYSRRCPY